MKKVLLSLAVVACGFAANAQNIPNGSFENTTGNDIDGWAAITGKVAAVPSYTISIQSTNYTVNPSQGSKFALVANDTTGAPQGQVFVGRMQSRFAWTKRPARMFSNILYFTGVNTETFAISVVMFRDNGGTNDTILNRYVYLTQAGSLFPNPSGGVIPWLTLTSEMGAYTGNNTPDSCVITFIASGAWTQGNQGSTSPITALALDNIVFSSELTSVNDKAGASVKAENVQQISNYPNPASTSTTISFDLPLKSNVELSVLDINGREVYSENLGQKEAGSHAVLFNTSSLKDGIYIYNIKSDYFTGSNKLIVNR